MAAASLGRLTLDLVTRIGNFTGPMSQAERQARNSSESIASSFNVASVAAKAFGAVVAGASVAGVAAFVNQTITAGNEVKKFSQLANASMSQFQYYAKGAETAGISMESFADKMKDMQDRIGDFQQTGGGPLADFFENIAPLVGVTIQQFQKLSGPEAMQLYYDSLVKVGASQNDMKFYMEAIISDSSLLIPLLENGGAGFKKWGDAAQSAGAIMSDSMVSQLALAKENLQMLDLQWQGFQATLVNNVMPVVQSVSDNFDTIKAIAMALGAAIATKLVVQMGMLSIEFVKGVIEGIRYQMTLAAMAGQTITLTSATVGLRTAMLGLVGGPGGLAILAIQAIAAGAAFLYMKNSSDESEESLRKNNESVDDAIKKYKELDEVKRRAQLVSEKANLRDLAKEYDEINSKLITATYSFSRHNDMTTEQSKQVNALVAEYKKTGDIEEFSKKINALSFINQTSKDRFNTLGGSVKDAGDQFKSQKTFVDQMAPAIKDVGGQAKQTAGEVAQLSEELKKLLGVNAEGANKSNYLKEMVNLKVDPKLAEMLYEARKAEGLQWGKNQVLSDAVRNSVLERWKADQGLNKTLEERAKIEERNKKAIEAQGNAMKVNAKVAANAAKYNFAGIESKNRLPAGLLSAIHMQESKGDANAYNKSSGATGGFQFLKATGDQYGIKNRKDLSQSAEAAGKYMAYLLKLFEGDLDKAVSAYHAGEGNVQRGTNIGPVNRQYVKNIKGYMAGSSGVKFNEEYSSDDWVKEQEKLVMEREKREKDLVETKKAIQVSYYSEWQTLEFENRERIKEINKTFINDSSERDRLLGLQAKAYEGDVGNWIKAQDERVKVENEANQQIILARQNTFNLVNNPLSNMAQMGIEANARASMNPQEYQRWQMGNEQQDGYSQLSDSLYSAREGIRNDEYTTDTEKYAKLNEAYKIYLDSKKALSESYSKQEQELAQTQYDSQLGLWGNLLGQAQNTWSQMTQAVKDSEGEQSGAFKAMFLMQQMFAIGSALVSTHLAATQVAADATIPFFGAKVLASKAMLAMGYANVGLIAGQTIAGMAHDGIDNIPKEGTWLLDKGERVVDSRTNADLKNYLSNRVQEGPSIVINNNTPSRVTTNQGSDGKTYVSIDDVEGYLLRSVNDPNSKYSKAMQQNYNASRRR
ncbi:MAG: transglycosylase SLT domain-containing protein [Acinetobacter sp.]